MSMSRRGPEPRQFFGDPASLARDNTYFKQYSDMAWGASTEAGHFAVMQKVASSIPRLFFYIQG